ncbi:MAG: phosphoribosyltransferase [Candidatus Bathyarchaeota archaeon]|nr:phosphoribosyltransferase [Candidatus Bathyarchaeota archaeon]
MRLMLLTIKVSNMGELKFLYLTWDDVQRLAEKTADKIKEDGFTPDIMIAISRGGFDPARIISDQLSIRKLASIQIIYYSSVNEKMKEPQVLFPLNAQIKGLKVLVVDDVSDSGHSLLAAKEYTKDMGAEVVKVATLHHKPWSKYKPDYFAEVVDQWILYPWEPNESIQDLVQMLSDSGLAKEEIPKKLREIGYTEHELKRYLRI